MKNDKNNRKISLLLEQGVFNTRSAKVVHQLFLENEFFDPHDIVQVKYEMLRWARLKKGSIQETAKSFGFSRPAFYQARSTFELEGLAGLMPKKRGPKNRYKLSEDVVKFIQDVMTKDRSLTISAIVRLIKERYDLDVHPRSITRVLNLKEIPDNGEKK